MPGQRGGFGFFVGLLLGFFGHLLNCPSVSSGNTCSVKLSFLSLLDDVCGVTGLESCKINYFCKLFQRTNINKESVESNDRLCIISVAFSLLALDHCYRKNIYFFLLIKV